MLNATDEDTGLARSFGCISLRRLTALATGTISAYLEHVPQGVKTRYCSDVLIPTEYYLGFIA